LSVAALPSIPPNWNSNADGFCFQYLSTAGSSPQRLLVKSLRMDRVLMVHATVKSGAAASSASQSASIKSLDLNVDDHVNSAALPSAAAPAAASSSGPDFSKLYKDLPALLARYDSAVLDPLLPKPASVDAGADKQRAAGPGPAHDPLRVPPRGGFQPPSYDDENEYLRDPFRRPRGDFHGDLAVGGGPNGGMLMGPRNFPGMTGGGGGAGGPMRPPGMAPRFDPYGPVPGMGDPDFDELPPPGVAGPNLPGIGGPLGGPQQPRRGPGGGGGGMGGGFPGMQPRGGPGFGGGFGGPNFGGGGFM
jgi:translation initiation factor IF-2